MIGIVLIAKADGAVSFGIAVTQMPVIRTSCPASLLSSKIDIARNAAPGFP